jgi:uncharacterized protein
MTAMTALEAKCPICKRVTRQREEYFPFCSERCQILDLGAWSSEEYKIPGARAQALSEEDDDEKYDR